MFPSATVPPPAATPAPASGVPSASRRVLTPEQTEAWRSRITGQLEATKTRITEGKTNVERYIGQALASVPTDHEVSVPSDYYYVETKRNELFFRLPDVFVKPEQPGKEDAAVVFQAALNRKLGPRGVNVLPTMKQVIVDLLVPTGYAGVAVGYQTITNGTVNVFAGYEPDPTAPPQLAPGGVLGLSMPAMKPKFVPTPNIVAAWIYVEHVRAADLLCDGEFSGLDFDKSPWVAQRFREDVTDEQSSGSEVADERRFIAIPGGTRARKQRVGTEVWYRAHRFDPDVQHPDKIRTFKIYDDDRDGPIEVRDHPHQRYASPAGKLAAGMRGYGVKILTLRYVPDTWMPPSDCSMARNTADELSKGRTQMLQSRDRNQPQWGFDATRVDKDIQAKIEQNTIKGGIPFNGPGQDATWPIQKGNGPKESYQFNEIAHGDLQRIWRTGDNQVGVLSDTVKTATEQQITASSAQSASESDRNVVVDWYADKIASEVAALMQLYTDETEFVELLGADAQRLKNIPPQVQQQAQQAGQDARVLVPWNKDAIAGQFAFSVKPNSQVYVDAAQEANLIMKDYQFFANSPNINKAELERQILTRRGYDVSKLMQQPPPRESAPPQVSVSAKGEDFNPQLVQGAAMLSALAQLGVPIDAITLGIAKQTLSTAQTLAQQMPPPMAGAMPGAVPSGLPQAHPQTEHGGAVALAEPLSKHQVDQTHGMQGSGDHAPQGAGGLR